MHHNTGPYEDAGLKSARSILHQNSRTSPATAAKCHLSCERNHSAGFLAFLVTVLIRPKSLEAFDALFDLIKQWLIALKKKNKKEGSSYLV